MDNNNILNYINYYPFILFMTELFSLLIIYYIGLDRLFYLLFGVVYMCNYSKYNNDYD